MDIVRLCEGICLQKEMREPVLAFAKSFDFSTVEKQLKAFRDYNQMKPAHEELMELLGEDPGHVKMLACMLKAGADLYDDYVEKGISDQIYFETMKCYTRFIEETHTMIGKWEYDRDFWTTRQAGFHLFRVGELEYEVKPENGKTVISVHIPSDAVFTPKAVDESLEMVKDFWKLYNEELLDCEYLCDSWLLEPALKEMLPTDSNILSFQNRFEVFDEGEANGEFIEWLFQKNRTADYQELPERTSLQRKVKAHLLNGGVIRNTYGRMYR